MPSVASRMISGNAQARFQSFRAGVLPRVDSKEHIKEGKVINKKAVPVGSHATWQS